ncbi:hypothetical protein YPF_0210 [Yersinia pestis biovar Orientalis str. India 195]|nr:hypothetical protein YPF_0210 [Yersinia pestis biovar Orientalis str. India 195]
MGKLPLGFFLPENCYCYLMSIAFRFLILMLFVCA